jgi:capsular polysaccharide biosynthesis protein
MRANSDIVPHEQNAVAPVSSGEERRSLRLSRNQLLIVLASMLVTATIAVVFSSLGPPIYNTSRSIIVYSGNNPNDNDILSTAIESIVKSKGMAAEVKRRGGFEQSIDQISGMIGTDRSTESPYMDVVVSSPDKAESEAISSQVIPSLRSVFENNQRETPVDQRISGPIFQEVFTFPLQSTSTFPAWFAGVFGALLGGLVPYLFFLYRNMRKPVLASAQDVTEALDLPVLVKVPVLTGRSGNPQDAVAGVISAVERLSVNEPIHRLVLVGPGTSDERATLSLAIANVIARSFGQPVALVDADLEQGSLTSLIGAGDTAGLSECLSGQLSADTALVNITDAQIPQALEAVAAPEGMVRFLGAGIDRSRNILRMRSAFHRVLESMAGRYVVIINGPQIPGPVPTSQLLSLADATLMVVVEGETRLTDARLAGDALRSFASGPAGVVVLRR